MQLVYLSPVPWASFAQRPHKFANWFRKTTGGRVLWIEPYPTRLPTWQDLRRKGDPASFDCAELPEGLVVISPRACPIEPLPGSSVINRMLWAPVFKSAGEFLAAGPTILGVGKPSELALQLLSAGGFVRSFYDAMDDFPAFYTGLSRIAIARRERKIVRDVTKVVVSSTALHLRWGDAKNISIVRNACDIQIMPAFDADSKLNSDRSNVLGYVGTIGQWFDWDLVAAIARAKPLMSVRLIGPVFTPPPFSLPINVQILPACAHSAAIAAMQEFAVGLIPFKRNRLTESVDPIKYYEYRAIGLPVISSFFGEMRHHCNSSGVFILDDSDDLVQVSAAVDAALAYSPTVPEIENFRLKNSWERRYASMGIVS